MGGGAGLVRSLRRGGRFGGCGHRPGRVAHLRPCLCGARRGDARPAPRRRRLGSGRPGRAWSCGQRGMVRLRARGAQTTRARLRRRQRRRAARSPSPARAAELARQSERLRLLSRSTSFRRMKSRRIGMLGAGNMASALIRGLLASKSVTKEQIVASDVRADHLKELEAQYGIKTFSDNLELAKLSNLVVLAVKPQVVDRVLDQMADGFAPDTLLVSIAAGVPIQSP